MVKSVERLKEEILVAGKANGGYSIPGGYLFESFNTPLHVAMRELLSEGKIYYARNENTHEVYEVTA